MAIWFSDEMWFHSEAERDLYAAAGMYLVTWASIESSAFSQIHLLRDHFGGDVIHKGQVPRTLKRRIDFFRKTKTLNGIPAEFHEPCSQFCARISAESQFRHDLAHGLKANFLKLPVEFRLLRPDDAETNPHTVPQKIIRLEDIISRYTKLQNISKIQLAMLSALAAKLP